MRKPIISIVGAGGMVGTEILEIIEKRKISFKEIMFFGSGKRTKYVVFKNKRYILQKPSIDKLKKSDIVFFVSSDDVARKFAKPLSLTGVWCIDDSSAFRMDKDVPLVIPEINGNLISEKNKLIAGPNCTLTPLAVSCFNIHKKYRIQEIRIATYQAVSGAGKRALNEFISEIESFVETGKIKIKEKTFPHQIAFNIFPQVGDFDKNGNSSEENKVEEELKKIWRDNGIKISCYAVRIPVIRGHSIAAWIKTEKRWDLKDLSRILLQTDGCKFFKNHEDYQTPINMAKKYYVAASRLKKTPFKNEFSLWLCGDNLYKGAALNSVQIAEIIIKKFF